MIAWVIAVEGFAQTGLSAASWSECVTFQQSHGHMQLYRIKPSADDHITGHCELTFHAKN